MSYILDALRRAEAERERGAVPGLNAQPFNPAAGGRRAGAPRRRLLAIVIGALLVVGIVIGLALLLRGGPDTALPTAAVVAQAPGAEPANPPPAAAPLATPPATAPREDRPAAPPPVVQAPAAQAARVRPSYIDAAPEPKPVPRKATPAASEASAPAASVRIYKLAELPDNIRAELPKLTLGGSMYSENPAARMVIVNGQVLHEHDPITSELSLDHITTKAAVFAYKGYQYEMPF